MIPAASLLLVGLIPGEDSADDDCDTAEDDEDENRMRHLALF